LAHDVLAKGGTFEYKELIEGMKQSSPTAHLKLEKSTRIEINLPESGKQQTYRFKLNSNHYATPRSQRQEQVDGFLTLAKKNYMFQMTISENHSFIPKKIMNTAQHLGWYPNDFSFVFVVPEIRYEDFKYQKRLSVEKKKDLCSKKGADIKQYALKINQKQVSSLFEDLTNVFEKTLYYRTSSYE
jgi:hypothetical protein